MRQHNNMWLMISCGHLFIKPTVLLLCCLWKYTNLIFHKSNHFNEVVDLMWSHKVLYRFMFSIQDYWYWNLTTVCHCSGRNLCSVCASKPQNLSTLSWKTTFTKGWWHVYPGSYKFIFQPLTLWRLPEAFFICMVWRLRDSSYIVAQ